MNTRSDPGGARACGRRRDSRVGLTLLELLAVLAILGILASLLVPVAGRARNAARRAKVRVQFAQWTAACEAFRSEYGFYPAIPQNKVNGGSSNASASSVADADTCFQEVLGGRGAGPGNPPAFRSREQNLNSGTPSAQNPRRIPFYAFAADEIDAAGRVVDAFGNTDIAVVFDTDGDGLVAAADIRALAVGSREQPAVTAAPAVVDVPAAGIRAGMVFFSAGAGWEGGTAHPEELILSWK
jgi:prepilin-type N-terminal cleavage/methylation domain-containing protein